MGAPTLTPPPRREADNPVRLRKALASPVGWGAVPQLGKPGPLVTGMEAVVYAASSPQLHGADRP
jgi:hypothetical protein